MMMVVMMMLVLVMLVVPVLVMMIFVMFVSHSGRKVSAKSACRPSSFVRITPAAGA